MSDIVKYNFTYDMVFKSALTKCPKGALKLIKEFVPDLKVVVIKGNANERQKLIAKINDFDLVITSYDLLKRDIKIIKFEYHPKEDII